MQEKEELKKQVIILGIILAIVIVLAVVLNINNRNTISNTASNNNYSESISEDKNKQTTDEMINNLKGLIEQQSEEEVLDTSGAETTSTNSGETVKILETEYD